MQKIFVRGFFPAALIRRFFGGKRNAQSRPACALRAAGFILSACALAASAHAQESPNYCQLPQGASAQSAGPADASPQCGGTPDEGVTFTVGVSSGGGGTITPSGNLWVSLGEKVAFTLAPDSTHLIDKVTTNPALYCDGTLTGNTYTAPNDARGAQKNCSIFVSFKPKPVNGTCGSDNGKVLLAAPVNLCSAGNAGAVAGSGHPWSWTCVGTDGGVTASCSAQIKQWTVSASGNSGGTITPASQVVDHGKTASLTVTPQSGRTAAASGCGGSLIGTNYTTAAVTADCTVSATFSVTLLPTTTVLASNKNPSNVGDAVVLTATVSGGASPTGSVTFNEGMTLLCNAVQLSGASATCTVPQTNLGVGQHTFTATYSGDAANAGGTSMPFTQTVGAVAATYVVTPSVTDASKGSISPATPQTVNANATATFTLTPANNFTVDSVGGSCGGVLTGNALDGWSFTTNAVTANCTVIAQFRSATNATKVALTASPNPAAAGQQVTFTATVSAIRSTASASVKPGSAALSAQPQFVGSPPGVVTFRDGSDVLASVVLNGGVAMFTTTSLKAGVHTITADYAGTILDEIYLNSSASLSVTVNAQAVGQAVPAPVLSWWSMLALIAALATLTRQARRMM